MASKGRKLARLLVQDSGDVDTASLDNVSVTPTTVSDQANTSTGYFDLPAGSTAQRPSSPNTGNIRFNSTTGRNEVYDSDGWTAIASPPVISSVSPTSFNGESGETFTINGSAFETTASVKFITSGGAEFSAGSVTRVSSSQLTATTPQDFAVSDEPLSIKVVNGSGLSSVFEDVIDCGGTPSWTTAAGSLGVFGAGSSISLTVSATDSEGQTVSYLLASGSLPAGTSLDSSTGVISGTNTDTIDTTYNFTLSASDGINTSSRSFSVVIEVQNYFGDGSDGSGSY